MAGDIRKWEFFNRRPTAAQQDMRRNEGNRHLGVKVEAGRQRQRILPSTPEAGFPDPQQENRQRDKRVGGQEQGERDGTTVRRPHQPFARGFRWFCQE